MADSRDCQMSLYFSGSCGIYSHFPSETENVRIGQCKRDITSHMHRTHLSNLDASSEGNLLLKRAGIFYELPGADELTICPRHRYFQGLYWCPLKSCQHPSHSGKMKATKGLTTRWSARLYKEIKLLIPVGTAICRRCYDLERKKDSNTDLVNYEPAGSSESLEYTAKDYLVVQTQHNPDEQQMPKPMEVNYEPAGTSESLEYTAKDYLVVQTQHNPDEQQMPKPMEVKYKAAGTSESLEYTAKDYLVVQTQHNPDEQQMPKPMEELSESSEIESQASDQIHLSQISNWSEEDPNTSLADANFLIKRMSRGSVSPLRAQLRTDLNTVGSSSIYYYKKKANESIDCLLNVIAPGRSDQLRDLVFGKNPRKEDAYSKENFITKDIVSLYEETSDNNLKNQLLSLIASKHSKTELQRLIPGLTIYQIDRARLASTSIQGLSIPVKHKQPRQRMKQFKLQHALSFFFDPSFVQTVSYGVRELLLDSGEKLEIPDVVRTVCNSKIVEMYITYCEEVDFEPLGRTSLFKILKECAASKRTNLRGLDNITASGIEGFDMLEELVSSLRDAGHLSYDLADGIKAGLTNSKLYLKTDYKLHIQQLDSCADHCLNWSLSDPTNRYLQNLCDHTHTLTCDRCEQFKILQEQLDSAINKLPENLKEDAMKTVDDSVEQINCWKAHIVRTINQDQFRIKLLDDIKDHEALIIMDWAMKFLPMKYRQTQSEWFGQRGINWHVIMCIFRDGSQLRHHTYTHVLDGVKQDWYSIMSILEHTLLSIKVQLPQIKKVYLRSDNAGCYHNGHMWLCLPEVSKRTGIEIFEFCYSEAQAGKSYCDAKIAHMRQKIKTYVATGHNVCTAAEMKEALDSGQGVSGCQIAVMEIDVNQQVLKSHKLKNVTLYNDIKYQEGDMVMQKAFSIGGGDKLKLESLCDQSGGQAAATKPGYCIVKDFILPTKSKGKINVPPKQQSDQESTSTSHNISTEDTGIFSCPDSGCTLQFSNFSGLQDHLLVGKHHYALERETTYDLIKKQWASLCSEVMLSRKSIIPSKEHNQTATDGLPMGWALKKAKATNRFSGPVKEFLQKKIDEGKITGKKANPHDVMREMRGSREAIGERTFPLKDCLNVSQINSYFSRLAFLNTQKKPKVEKVSEESEEIDADLLAVVSALEESKVFEHLQESV